jgi:hypothetical protein
VTTAGVGVAFMIVVILAWAGFFTFIFWDMVNVRKEQLADRRARELRRAQKVIEDFQPRREEAE